MAVLRVRPLTEAGIGELPVPAFRRARYYLGLGLTLAITPDNKRIFTQHYHRRGRPRRQVIGTWPDMPLAAARARGAELRHPAPRAPIKPSKPTVTALEQARLRAYRRFNTLVLTRAAPANAE